MPHKMLVRVIAVAVPALLCAACSSGASPGGSGSLSPPTVELDPSLSPAVPELPGVDDDEPRPVARVSNAEGEPADFVANELWVATDDEDVLAGLVARWNGKVLRTFDPQEHGLSDLPAQHLVRVDASAADTDRLSDDLASLHPDRTGAVTVSTGQGMRLLAAGAAEASDGLSVGVNWLGAGSQFMDGASIEAPTGPPMGTAYDPNAFAWHSHNAGSVQDIGVTRAWQALEYDEKLANTVSLAILDMGFEPDDDMPADWTAISNVPGFDAVGSENFLPCSGGTRCPWHGTGTAGAAMAVADNGYGTAGPAGPVAEPILIYTMMDHYTSISALGLARAAGARIANMSYGTRVPASLAWSVRQFALATAAFRASGMLMFAASGNAGANVDATDCVAGACWEKAVHTPCENPGVLCVGGLEVDSQARASFSNFGAENVDLHAPGSLWLGPDPDNPANETYRKSGTSYASPYAAGVAALVWAAAPDLRPGEVVDLLLDSAHRSPQPRVDRYVDAYEAVKGALGNLRPHVAISVPADGTAREVNQPATFTAAVEDFEDGAPCCTVRWSSDLEGDLGVGVGGSHRLAHTFTTLGNHVVTATATDSEGGSSSASIDLEIVNSAPNVSIVTPQPKEELFRDVPYAFSALASDRNEPGGGLGCDRLTWTSSEPDDPFPRTGCSVEGSFATDGTRTLTVTGIDSHGTTGDDSVSVTVVEPPDNLPPTARILLPEDEATIDLCEPLPTEGTASDPEGESDLTYHWEATHPYDPSNGSGGETVVIGDTAEFTWTPVDVFYPELSPCTGIGGGYLRIELSVTDPNGRTGTDVLVVRVQKS